jgi:hypothetical protein
VVGLFHFALGICECFDESPTLPLDHGL